jgi:nucleoside 2-deoxyribosyltransferase
MKLFCSYAFTGEDEQVLFERMGMVVDALNTSGHDAYCPLFDPHKIALQEKGDILAIFDYAFKNLAMCDGMVAIIASERKSEGQLMEVGAALAADKPLYLFIHSSVGSVSHLPKLASATHVWGSEEELKSALQTV